MQYIKPLASLSSSPPSANPQKPPVSILVSVLGASGGPLDGMNCSYMIRTSDVSIEEIVTNRLEGKVLCVDGGAGLSAVVSMLLSSQNSSSKIMPHNVLLDSYNDTMTFKEYHKCPVVPFGLDCVKLGLSPLQAAVQVVRSVTDYFITHPHLDHVAGLVINSAGFDSNDTKTVWGSQFTIDALKNHVFNGVIWPNLQSHVNGNFLELRTVHKSTNPNPNFSITAFETRHGVVSDGSSQQHSRCDYPSTSYLIWCAAAQKSVLVFGDLESSECNQPVWDAVAPLVRQGILSAIVIECSTANVPKNTPLYGHLTPDHLFKELIYLGSKVDKVEPLNGVHILISHVKEDHRAGDPRRVILKELNLLNERFRLGCEFTVVFPGVTYAV